MGPADEELLDARHRADRLVAEGVRIDRNYSPDDRFETSAAYRVIQDLAGGDCLSFVRGEECHGHAKLAWTEVTMAGSGECLSEEGERNLGQHARPVAGA